ncbi:unnamed protein product [Ascophyllum nodosum]
MKALTNRRVKPGSNPIHTLSEMADDARDLRANGTDISDEIVCLLFLPVLPEEYDVFRQIIGREKEPLTIDRLMGELRARSDLSRKVTSRSSDTALVASGSRREKSKRCSQRICSICREIGHDPNKCAKMKKEDANRAISDQVGLVADEDAFVSISQGEREFRFGCSRGTEGLGRYRLGLLTVLQQGT